MPESELSADKILNVYPLQRAEGMQAGELVATSQFQTDSVGKERWWGKESGAQGRES